jgi:uncharacterized protein YeaO (DUF488 family)
MPIQVVRLGTPRDPEEGLRLGTVRRPPRGVRKEDYARKDYFDLWLPELAPSDSLFSYAHDEPFTRQRWSTYVRRYRREMKEPRAQRLIALLAALSHQAELSVGCYCADESRCHRSVLRAILAEAGATMA